MRARRVIDDAAAQLGVKPRGAVGRAQGRHSKNRVDEAVDRPGRLTEGAGGKAQGADRRRRVPLVVRPWLAAPIGREVRSSRPLRDPRGRFCVSRDDARRISARRSTTRRSPTIAKKQGQERLRPRRGVSSLRQEKQIDEAVADGQAHRRSKPHELKASLTEVACRRSSTVSSDEHPRTGADPSSGPDPAPARGATSLPQSVRVGRLDLEASSWPQRR